jgi:hypothetical protein
MLHLEGFNKQVRFTGKARCVMILAECAHTSGQFRGVYCRARARCDLWGVLCITAEHPQRDTNPPPETVPFAGAQSILHRSLFQLMLAAAKDGAGVVGRNGIGWCCNRYGGVIEPAEINDCVGAERDGRWHLAACRTWGSEAARIEIQV